MGAIPGSQLLRSSTFDGVKASPFSLLSRQATMLAEIDFQTSRLRILQISNPSCFSPSLLISVPLSHHLLQNLRFALDPVGTQLILILFWTSTFSPREFSFISSYLFLLELTCPLSLSQTSSYTSSNPNLSPSYLRQSNLEEEDATQLKLNSTNLPTDLSLSTRSMSLNPRGRLFRNFVSASGGTRTLGGIGSDPPSSFFRSSSPLFGFRLV